MEVLFTFHADDAEMYFGKTPVSVDMGTALYMLQQKDSMPQGKAWGDSFPAVVNHTSSSVARHHPDFLAAKQGDFDAAIRLVDDLVKDEKVIDVATRFPEAHVAYIHRQNGTGINMIPAAFAAKFSAAGMTVEDDIIAITNVSHTDASDVARLSRSSISPLKESSNGSILLPTLQKSIRKGIFRNRLSIMAKICWHNTRQVEH